MGRFATLIIGGLIGAGVMAATARKTGSETRAEIKGLISDMKETATRANAEGGAGAVANEFINKGKEVASDAVANGQATVASATAKVQDVATDVTGSADADDLKRKIDEARARIVERMASNAAGNTDSQAGSASNTDQEAVIESVEDVSGNASSASATNNASSSAAVDAAMNAASTPAPGPGAGSAPSTDGAHV